MTQVEGLRMTQVEGLRVTQVEGLRVTCHGELVEPWIPDKRSRG